MTPPDVYFDEDPLYFDEDPLSFGSTTTTTSAGETTTSTTTSTISTTSTFSTTSTTEPGQTTTSTTTSTISTTSTFSTTTTTEPGETTTSTTTSTFSTTTTTEPGETTTSTTTTTTTTTTASISTSSTASTTVSGGTSDFPFEPQFVGDSSGTVTPKTLKVEFGDGYNQRAADGLNSNPKEWTLKWKLNAADSETLLDFMESHGGNVSFYWTPPRKITPHKYIFLDWTEVPYGNIGTEITAKIEETYDP
jgi:phage-related protein